MPRSVLFRLDSDKSGDTYPAYNTFYQGKHILTAIGIQTALHTTDTLAVLNQDDEGRQIVLANQSVDNEGGQIILMEVITETAAIPRVRKALDAANDRDMVYFAVRNRVVYDAVFNALGVDASQSAISP